MKNVLRFFLLFAVIFCIKLLQAKPVDLHTAQLSAYNFLFDKIDSSIKKSFKLELYKQVYDVETKSTLYYIFNVLPQGFIIITADDNLVPVIAYSFEASYVEGKNPVQEEWISLQLKLAVKDMIEDPSNIARWANLQTRREVKQSKAVAPLCTTRWNQDIHYNFMCPVDSNGPGYRAYAGCVATAMGQVMKRWNHPVTGNSGYSYQHIWPMYYYNYGTLYANFAATTYNWSNMPNQINASNRIDVATLLFHCGVSVKMNYGPDGSGAHTESVPFALKQFFKYHESIEFIERAFMPPQRWDSIIISQLEKGFPMVYSGSEINSGHAWVVDGYQDSCYFHVNWGWSGWNNGYYYFSNLNSGNGNFTDYQGAVINVFPSDYVGLTKNTISEISIYPNPASSHIIISNLDRKFVVEIIDMKGRLIKSVENTSFINIEDISDGVYIVKITNDNAINTSKIFILK